MRIICLGDCQDIHIKKWINHFKKENEIFVLTSQPNDFSGVKVYDISRKIPFAFIKLPILGKQISMIYDKIKINKLKELIDKIDPDLIHAHYLTDYGILGSKIDFHPYVITCLGSDVLIAPEKFGEQHVKEMKKALRKADLITVESEYMNKSIEQLGIDNRVEIVRHGVDSNKFNLDVRADTSLKQDIKSSDEIVIISTRNFEPVYNISCIIQGFHLLQKKIPNVKLILLGMGSMEKQLKTLVKRLNISEKTLFFGHISHDEIPKYFVLSDIYVSSSLSDAMSVSKLEAMASGLVPVVSDIPANREIINDGENGFIFENNPIELSKKLSYCVRNYDMIKESISKSNLKMIEETFNWNKNMESMNSLYKNLCGV